MTMFSQLPSLGQSAILALLLLLTLLLGIYQSRLYVARHMGAMGLNGVGMVLLFLLIALLSWTNDHRAAHVPIPWGLLLLLWAVLTGVALVLLWREYQRSLHTLSSNSVKYAVDKLSTGLCVFSSNGLPVLCNHQMYRLIQALCGRDVQMVEELEAALADPPETIHRMATVSSYRFPDGQIWLFSKEPMTADATYVLYSAVNVTELHGKRAQLEQRQQELSQMVDQAQRLTQNMVEITHQQEVLTAKMRVHNKMGNCVLTARQYVRRGCPKTEKSQLLAAWRESLDVLQGETVQAQEEDPCSMVVSLAGRLGLAVSVQGDLGQDSGASDLLVAALRECVTNALNHAGATTLTMAISRQGGVVQGTFTNNGTPPACPIQEGGGLTSLRQRVEQAGGTMTVSSTPIFALTVAVPETYTERRQVSCTTC